ncbi:MAG: hypothetical protein WCF36_20895 [Candidatus Nanopelagicales bacterium]
MGTSNLDARTSDHASAPPPPQVLLFDVYETLSDLSPLGSRFVDVGAPAHLAPIAADRAVDDAVAHIMGGFDALDVPSDVPAGLPALGALGPWLVTLSNGQASVAEQLVERAGDSGHFERQLSTEDAWINRTEATYPGYFNAPTLEATSLTHLAHLLRA